MTDKQLVKFARDFRAGMLEKKSSYMWCYAVSAPLVSLLEISGVVCKLEKAFVDKWEHWFIRLSDGRILDATADQFKNSDGENMPPVFLGHKPSWYLAAAQKE